MANNASTAEINPLDLKPESNKEDSLLVNDIVETETSEGQKAILGAAPTIDTSLLQNVPPPTSLLLVSLKIFFMLLVVAGFASVVFFTSQLTTVFDFVSTKLGIPNITQELSATNSELITLKTDINLYKYLQIKGNLDAFSYNGDSYIQNYKVANSQTATDEDKKKALGEMDSARSKLRNYVLELQDLYAENIYIPLIDPELTDDVELNTLFKERLVAKLNEKASSYANNESSQARREFKNYDQTIILAGNTQLRQLVIGADYDALSDDELYEFIKAMNALIVNDFSIIQTIKDNRIKWSDIMKEIELRTIEVDSFYDENLYEDVGGIRYTSYDFDSVNRKIDIVGETKRFDTRNFTMIADLIDKLNQSGIFMNGEMRSFSKSGSLEEGYKASIKLTFNLQ